jgi:hypothetical protein
MLPLEAPDRVIDAIKDARAAPVPVAAAAS